MVDNNSDIESDSSIQFEEELDDDFEPEAELEVVDDDEEEEVEDNVEKEHVKKIFATANFYSKEEKIFHKEAVKVRLNELKDKGISYFSRAAPGEGPNKNKNIMVIVYFLSKISNNAFIFLSAW